MKTSYQDRKTYLKLTNEKEVKDEDLDELIECALKETPPDNIRDATIFITQIAAYTSEKIRRSVNKLHKSSLRIEKLNTILIILTTVLIILTMVLIMREIGFSIIKGAISNLI